MSPPPALRKVALAALAAALASAPELAARAQGAEPPQPDARASAPPDAQPPGPQPAGSMPPWPTSTPYAAGYMPIPTAPPGWQWDAKKERWRDMRPKRLPYVAGTETPAGYEYTERVNLALTITGAALFGVSYLGSTIVALVADVTGKGDEFAALYVPLVGPFITLGTANSELSREAGRGGRPLLVLDGLAQCGGAAMFIAGIMLKTPAFRRLDLPPPPPPAYAPIVSIGPARVSAMVWF